MPVAQDGTVYAFGANPGVSAQDMLTMTPFSGMDDNPDAEQIAAPLTELQAATSTDAPKFNYLWYVLGVFILLVLMKYAGEKGDGPQPQLAGVGVYNFIVIGIMSMLFILTGKIILNKYPVRGMTDIFNAV